MNRRFSLEDFDRQIRAGVNLGVANQPKPAATGGKGQGAMQGGLGGATVGAQVGGPWGAAIGGAVGAIGGGQASKGK